VLRNWTFNLHLTYSEMSRMLGVQVLPKCHHRKSRECSWYKIAREVPVPFALCAPIELSKMPARSCRPVNSARHDADRSPPSVFAVLGLRCLHTREARQKTFKKVAQPQERASKEGQIADRDPPDSVAPRNVSMSEIINCGSYCGEKSAPNWPAVCGLSCEAL
jgi:hypothetical protein